MIKTHLLQINTNIKLIDILRHVIVMNDGPHKCNAIYNYLLSITLQHDQYDYDAIISCPLHYDKIIIGIIKIN